MTLTFNGKSVAPERSGWRDEAISRRHREWGNFATAVDIDFVLIESTFAAEPKALIEYKHATARPAKHFQLRLLGTLATMASIPFFLAKYWTDTWAFIVMPQNDHAREWMKSERRMSERQYVTFLQDIRGVREQLPAHLQDVLPPDEAA